MLDANEEIKKLTKNIEAVLIRKINKLEIIDRYEEVSESNMIPITVSILQEKANELGLKTFNEQNTKSTNRCNIQMMVDIKNDEVYFQKDNDSLSEPIKIDEKICKSLQSVIHNKCERKLQEESLDEKSLDEKDIEKLKRFIKYINKPQIINLNGIFFKSLNPQSQELCIKISCSGNGLDGRFFHIQRTEYEKVYNVSIYDSNKQKVIDYKYTDEQIDIERNIVNIIKTEIKKYYGNLKHCSCQYISETELEKMKENNTEPMYLKNKIYGLSFKERLELRLAGQDTQYDEIYVGETPTILQKIGFDNLPVVYSQEHVKDAVREKSNKHHYHGLKVETIAEMPTLLANPILLYDSLGGNINDAAIIAVSDKLDDDKNPIVIVIKPNKKKQLNAEQVDSNYVATMFGHDNIAQQIKEALRQDKILFIDKNKSQILSAFTGLQLPCTLDNSNSDGVIHQSKLIVNKNKTCPGEENNEQSSEISDSKGELFSKAQSVLNNVNSQDISTEINNFNDKVDSRMSEIQESMENRENQISKDSQNVNKDE